MSKRAVLTDSNPNSIRYFYCPFCNNMIKADVPSSLSFITLEGKMDNVVYLSSKIDIKMRCKCKHREYKEIHSDTINAHKACANINIPIYYDYGEIIDIDVDKMICSFKGDRVIFRMPSLDIYPIDKEEILERIKNLKIDRNKLIVRYDHPGVFLRLEGICNIDISLADEYYQGLNNKYFETLNRELNNARTYIEEFIDELLKEFE